MANRLGVPNPFTKVESRMRRSTSNSMWVDAADPYPPRQRAGPRLHVQHVAQSQKHASQVPARAHVETEQLSPAENISPMNTSHPSQLHTVLNSPDTRHDSLPDSSSADHCSPSHRKESDATVFPYFPATTQKPERKPKIAWWKQALPKAGGNEHDDSSKQSTSQNQDWWHTAREIYDSGPQGEGQKAWRVLQQSRKGHQSQAETRQTTPPTHPHPRRYEQHCKQTQPSTTRKESEFSCTSYDVPLSLDASTAKRTTDKSLPPLPQPHAESIPRKNPVLTSSTPYSTHKQHTPWKTPDASLPAKDPWWHALATHHHHHHRHKDDKHATTSHTSLKAKISRPIPLPLPANDVYAYPSNGPTSLFPSPPLLPTSTTAIPTIPTQIKTQPRAQPRHHHHRPEPNPQSKPHPNAPPHFSPNNPHTTHDNPIGSRDGDSESGKDKDRDTTPPTYWLDRFTVGASRGECRRGERKLGMGMGMGMVKRKGSEESFFGCKGLE